MSDIGFPPLEKGGQGGFALDLRKADREEQIPLDPPFAKGEAEARMLFDLDGIHQKYPSSFFFSIDAPGSWSITRPWRSELVVTSISAMIFSSESASESMAPVSG